MEKQKIVALILEQLEADLVLLKEATLATYDAATNEESKPENQYDTRALEASYLAGAQAQRVNEIEELIYLYRSSDMRNFSAEDSIDLTSLIELDFKGKRSQVFLMAKGGGLKIIFEGKAIQTVTPASQLGEALMGLHIDDIAVVEDKQSLREYKVIKIS